MKEIKGIKTIGYSGFPQVSYSYGGGWVEGADQYIRTVVRDAFVSEHKDVSLADKALSIARLNEGVYDESLLDGGYARIRRRINYRLSRNGKADVCCLARFYPDVAAFEDALPLDTPVVVPANLIRRNA